MGKYDDCIEAVQELLLNGHNEAIADIIEKYEEKVSKRKENDEIL